MKKLKLNFLVLLVISIFIVACRSESFITEENTEISIPKTGEYILKEAPLFKQFLLNNVTNKTSANKNNVTLNDDRPIFIVYKENAVSYSTIVKNVNDSSFNVWVYTIREDKEDFFSAEYIPKSSIINNDLNHFTGTVNYRSIDGSLLGTIKFINGEPKNKSTMTVTGENGKVSTCSLLIISTPVSCTSPEHHMPWDTCYETGSNRPYYETEIHKICTESQFPNIGLDGGGGYGGGGGNSSGSEPAAEISIQDVFNMQLMQSNYPELTPEQYSYIENNQYIGGQILGYFGWNLTDNYHQLAMWCIDYLRENNNFNLSEYQAFKKIEDFINFGQQFFSDHPNTTWAEFENWFLEDPVINDLQNELIDDWYDTTRVKPTSRFKSQAKLNSIYNKVKTAANFKQYLQNFEPTFSVAHLMFDVGTTSSTAYAHTTPPENYWIKIVFNKDLDWGNIPQIVVADTFMHEMIHAEIFRKLLSLASTDGNIDIALVTQYLNSHNYPGLFDYYVKRTVGGDNWQHEVMAAHYVNIMVNFLKQVYGTQYTDIEYKTIVWMGLKDTIAWSLLPQSEKTLYLNTWNTNYWLWEM